MRVCWFVLIASIVTLQTISSTPSINSTFTYKVLSTQVLHHRTSLHPPTTSGLLVSATVSTATEHPDTTSDVDDDIIADHEDEDHSDQSDHSHDPDHDLMHAKHVPSMSKPVAVSHSVKPKPTASEYELAPSDLLNNLHSDELPVEHNEHYGHDELTPALSSQLVSSSDHFQLLARVDKLNITTTPKFPGRKQLLIISFDAFRYDYNRMFRRQMPHFERIAREGVWAPMGIQTAYVTKTFPTHFSIATGKPKYQVSVGLRMLATERN
jgi:hypothetical protein